MIGDGFPSAFSLFARLKEWGCNYEVASAFREALGMADCRRYDVVLSNIDLPDGRSHSLVSTLVRQTENLFFCLRRERDSLRLPAIVHGVRCLGAPAPRAGQFGRALKGSVRERCSKISETASRRETFADASIDTSVGRKCNDFLNNSGHISGNSESGTDVSSVEEMENVL